MYTSLSLLYVLKYKDDYHASWRYEFYGNSEGFLNVGIPNWNVLMLVFPKPDCIFQAEKHNVFFKL